MEAGRPNGFQCKNLARRWEPPDEGRRALDSDSFNGPNGLLKIKMFLVFGLVVGYLPRNPVPDNGPSDTMPPAKSDNLRKHSNRWWSRSSDIDESTLSRIANPPGLTTLSTSKVFLRKPHASLKESVNETPRDHLIMGRDGRD